MVKHHVSCFGLALASYASIPLAILGAIRFSFSSVKSFSESNLVLRGTMMDYYVQGETDSLNHTNKIQNLIFVEDVLKNEYLYMMLPIYILMVVGIITKKQIECSPSYKLIDLYTCFYGECSKLLIKVAMICPGIIVGLFTILGFWNFSL